MRKRVAGGAVLVAIAVGIWLSSLFKGLGPGGTDSGIGPADEVAVRVDTSRTGDASAQDRPGQDPSADEPLSDVGIAAGRPVPTVVIENRQYLLAVETEAGEVEYVPATLEEIVERAAQTPPDEDGLQIHIKRRRSSRAATEMALDEALAKAGIGEAAIRRHPDFVD